MCGPDSYSGSVLLLYSIDMFLFPGYFSGPLCFSMLLLRNASETQSPLSNYLLMFHVERASLFYSYKEQSERCPQLWHQLLSEDGRFRTEAFWMFPFKLKLNTCKMSSVLKFIYPFLLYNFLQLVQLEPLNSLTVVCSALY